MNSTLKKIIIPLLLVVILPAVTYSVYEITSLNDTEEVIQEIYVNQLDAILNSVNQYSDLVVSAWVNEINSSINKDPNGIDGFSQMVVNDLFLKNKSITQIYILTDLAIPKGKSVRRNNKSTL